MNSCADYHRWRRGGRSVESTPAGSAEWTSAIERVRGLPAWLRRVCPGRAQLALLKAGVVICAAFLAACDYPPEEVEGMRQQLQAEISRGQVYVVHSRQTLSYMIRNSDISRASEEERERVVRAVETDALEFLAKYRNYGEVRIYFLGDGTTGIDRPYVCRATDKSCGVSLRQPGAEARPWRLAPASRPTSLVANA